MMKYVFMSLPPKVRVKGKEIHGQTTGHTNKKNYRTDQQIFGNRDHTSNLIGI